MKVVVLDLDGTLISGTTSKKILKEAYECTMREVIKNVKDVPPILAEFNKDWPAAFNIPEFRRLFPKIYKKILKIYNLIEEEERAKKILSQLKVEYGEDVKFIVLTANPFANLVIRKLNLNDSIYKIISITSEIQNVNGYQNRDAFFKNYTEIKALKLIEIKQTYNPVVYVGDLEEDELAARKAGIRFINVRHLEERLYS